MGFAASIGAMFSETSALTGYNVQSMFRQLTDKVRATPLFSVPTFVHSPTKSETIPLQVIATPALYHSQLHEVRTTGGIRAGLPPFRLVGDVKPIIIFE